MSLSSPFHETFPLMTKTILERRYIQAEQAERFGGKLRGGSHILVFGVTELIFRILGDLF
jgi:hypothetical protein